MRRGIVAAALCVAALGTGVQAASAAPVTRFVAPTGSDASNDCSVEASPCATIQHGVDESVAGDTLDVAAGIYAGEVTIEKALSLVGASGTEVEAGPGTGMVVKSGGVSISGFTFANSEIGIELTATGKEIAIEDDVFRASLNDFAVLAEASKAIEDFKMNGNHFAAVSAIASDLQAKVPGIENEIAGNTFEGSSGAQLAVGGSSLQLAENAFEGGTEGCLEILGQGGTRPAAENVVVSGSRFADCEPYGVKLDPGVDGVEIRSSEFPGSYDGVFASGSSPWNVTENVEVHTNRFVGTTHLGVNNEAQGTLDAEQNWWGCDAGPGAAGCDPVSAGVDTANNAILAGLVGPPGSSLPNGNSIALNPGEQAEVAAFLLVNGLGVDNGIPSGGASIHFSSAIGTLSPAALVPVKGLAKSVFTAGTTPSSGSIVLEMDSGRTSVPVTIRSGSSENPPPPPPETPPGPRLSITSKNVLVAGSRATVGLVNCPLSCKVKPGKATISVGGHNYTGKVTPAGKLHAEATKPIRVALPTAVQKALKNGKKGKVKVKVTATDTAGRTAKRTFSVKISG